MGLAETQQFLAKLYTNSELRTDFFTNPEIACVEMGLSLGDVEKLRKLSAAEINIFANSLKWKRLGEVRELLPRTARVLGKNFTALFWQYAENYLPQGIKKHREDAIAFANFIIKVAQTEGIEPVWMIDLVRYEQTWLLADELPRCLMVCWLRYPIDKLEISEIICQQTTLAIWWRLSVRSPLRHIVLQLPL
jgi:hypothetical protein